MEESLSKFSRRKFIGYAGLAFLGGMSALVGREVHDFYEYDPSNPLIDVIHYKSPLPGRFFVVQLTDIHYGDKNAAVNAQTLEAAMNKVNQQLGLLGASPTNTIVAVTGDYVSKAENPKFHIKLPNGGETNLRDVPVMLEIMDILNADYRVGVLGNHDIKYSHRSELIKYLLEFGYSLPDMDQSILRDFPLPIWGLPDYTELGDTYDNFEVANIVKQSKLISGPSILLSHNASIVDRVGLGKLLNKIYFHVGHTHGGHTNHESLYPFVLSKDYRSQYIKGTHRVGSNIVHLPNGLGQHPQIIGRQVPAQIYILVFGN